MKHVIGVIVLGLSASGYPLTQLAIRRWGKRAAAVTECVCAGLALRDASMVADGVPDRLRRTPAVLLFLELGAGVVASLAGLPPLLSAQPTGTAAAARTRAADSVRRAAVAALFAIHTIRFGIYLRPDQGRRPELVITERGVPVARLLCLTTASMLPRLAAGRLIGRPAVAHRPVASRRSDGSLKAVASAGPAGP